MTSFKRWLGAGAIVLVVLALVACPALVPKATGSIPAMSFAHDDTDARTVALGSFFADDDNATYSAESSKPAVATVSVEDATLTVTPKGAGTTTVTVSATSSSGRDSATQSFAVTVASPPTPPANNPPAIRTVIQAMSVQVGSMTPLTLSDYYLDLENDALTYTATSHNPMVASVSGPDANSMITITAEAEGSTQITVTAADATLLALGAAIPQTFAVEVSAVPIEPPDNNQPRQLDDIPDLTGLMFGGSQDVDLDMYFTDDDGDDVTYTAMSSDMSVVTTSVSDSMVTITVVDSGMARIDITATDPYNRSVRASFNVEVINQAPMVVDTEPTQFGPVMTGDTLNIELSRYFSDPEGNMLTYGAMSDDDSIAMASTPSASGMTTITAMGEGAAMITITANDGTNADVSHMLTVTVDPTPVVVPTNNPPSSAGINAMSLVAGRTHDLDLSTVFTDPEGDALTYTAMSDNVLIATASDPGAGSMTTITAVSAGRAMITVTANDGTNAAVSDMFYVTVTAAPNVAPMVKGDGLPDIKMILGDNDSDPATDDVVEVLGINLSMYFEDPERYPLVYNAVVETGDSAVEIVATTAREDDAATTHIDETIPGGSKPDGTDFDTWLAINFKAAGTATITVTARDNADLSVSDTFMVTVGASNTSPAAETIDIPDYEGAFRLHRDTCPKEAIGDWSQRQADRRCIHPSVLQRCRLRYGHRD